MNRRIVTLLTDFGDGGYVAQMKAVLLSRVADVCLVDISHAIPPQDVVSGSIVLADSIGMFPRGTVHVAVVDPGVGTDRRLLAMQIGEWYLIGPDNGLLAVAAEQWPVMEIVELNKPEFWLKPLSKTFHGRDVMAPIAACIANGAMLASLGTETNAMHPSLVPMPTPNESGLNGVCLCEDRYGNLITNIREADLRNLDMKNVKIRLPNHEAEVRWVGTYGEARPGECVALLGSSGRLEIAIVNGSASKLFGHPSARVELTC